MEVDGRLEPLGVPALMPTVNGADPWLNVLAAVLTFVLVIVIG